MAALRLSTRPGMGMVMRASARARSSAEAGAFVADEQRAGFGEVGCRRRSGVSARIVGNGGEEVKAAGFERGEFGRRRRRRRDAEDGAGGGAQGFLVPLAGGAGSGENTSCAEGFGGADEGAEVAGVLQAGGDRRAVATAARVRWAARPRAVQVGGTRARRCLAGDWVSTALAKTSSGRWRARRRGEDHAGGVPLAQEDGLEARPAAHGFGEEVLAFDGDQAAARAARCRRRRRAAA